MKSEKLVAIKHQSATLSIPNGCRVVLCLPCLNEELTLRQVISDFRRVYPWLEIHVFDNASTDNSRQIALAEGVQLVSVPQRGKGNVVRRMFEGVDADVYVMVDSDSTYDVQGLLRLLEPIIRGEADMVVGSRLEEHSDKAFRRFHRFGNNLIQRLLNLLFKSHLTDICSGYRAMSRHFVESIPLHSGGFEVETELTVYSLMYGLRVMEVALPYRERPPHSHSKLRTIQDGYRVLLTIVWLARDLRPLFFFSLCGLTIFSALVLPSFHFFPNALYWHLSLTFLSMGLVMTGLILNTLSVKFSELRCVKQRESARRYFSSQKRAA